MRLTAIIVALLVALWLGAGAQALGCRECAMCSGDACEAAQQDSSPDRHAGGCSGTPAACSCSASAQGGPAPDAIGLATICRQPMTVALTPLRALDDGETVPPLQRPPIG